MRHRYDLMVHSVFSLSHLPDRPLINSHSYENSNRLKTEFEHKYEDYKAESAHVEIINMLKQQITFEKEVERARTRL